MVDLLGGPLQMEFWGPSKWPYTWVAGVIPQLLGVITQLITGTGSPCSGLFQINSKTVSSLHLDTKGLRAGLTTLGISHMRSSDTWLGAEMFPNPRIRWPLDMNSWQRMNADVLKRQAPELLGQRNECVLQAVRLSWWWSSSHPCGMVGWENRGKFRLCLPNILMCLHFILELFKDDFALSL